MSLETRRPRYYFLRDCEAFEAFCGKCEAIEHQGLSRNPHALAKAKNVYERYLAPGCDYSVTAKAAHSEAVQRAVEGGAVSADLFEECKAEARKRGLVARERPAVRAGLGVVSLIEVSRRGAG